MTDLPILYDYWRSSASYRVRITLNLLGIEYLTKPVNLLAGDHRSDDHVAVNPQGTVPVLSIEGRFLTQSLAIIEYLHAQNASSTLLPQSPEEQARVRQLSYAIAMDVHPICNLSVVAHVSDLTGGHDDTRKAWMQHFIAKGLNEFEGLLEQGEPGLFCHGDEPTMADCCLLPQLYNAHRWGVDYSGHVRIARVAAKAACLPAFQAAHPDLVRKATDA